MFRKRILYVTDDIFAADLLKTSLLTDHLPVDMVYAGSLTEARQKLARGPYDLVMLDYCFEDGTGVELCRELRSAGETMPIVFHSALARDVDMIRAREAGCSDYLVKPDDVDRVVSVISRRLAIGPVRMTWGPRRAASAVL